MKFIISPLESGIKERIKRVYTETDFEFFFFAGKRTLLELLVSKTEDFSFPHKVTSKRFGGRVYTRKKERKRGDQQN